MSFQQEYRYVVLKLKDINKYLTPEEKTVLRDIASKIDKGRNLDGKKILKCVVVERDWPEYEPTWRSIERRTEKGGLEL